MAKVWFLFNAITIIFLDSHTMEKEIVVLGCLGPDKDAAEVEADRWEEWRPTVGLCMHEGFPVARYELIYQKTHKALAVQVAEDIEARSETKVRLHEIDLQKKPWDFETVYAAFFDLMTSYEFDPERESYFLNISTGTHVMQICLFMLAEARYAPAKLIQSSFVNGKGSYFVIDLELERYNRLAQRFRKEKDDDIALLKGHISTANSKVEKMVDDILHVSSNFDYPILLTGSTGVGKTSLAKRIHELRVQKNRAKGRFIHVNCATLRGDIVKSELFGHAKGSFTDAKVDRIGLIESADGGTLFLDEIGELDPEVQKMLLTVLEDKEVRKLGDTKSQKVDFYLIAGTNSDLRGKVAAGEFREDLLARIDSFPFHLLDLKDRPEDIEPNLDRELEDFQGVNNINVTMSKEARRKYLEFATSPAATWNNNFRDLKASVVRMAAYADGGRITIACVNREIEHLRKKWSDSAAERERFPLTRKVLGAERMAELDRIALVQIETVIETCLNSRTRAEAGRTLYGASRSNNSATNYNSLLNLFLKRYGLDWDTIRANG